MNRMKYFLIAFAVLCCLRVSAQKLLTAAEISYEETRATTNRSGRPISRTSRKIVTFSPRGRKLQHSLPNGTMFSQITKCGDTRSLFYVTNGVESYRYEDPAALTLFEMGNYQPSVHPPVFTGESAVINGFNCKKAIMTASADGQDEQVSVWYTPDYKLGSSCMEDFFRALPGFPVSFSFREHPKMAIGTSVKASITITVTRLKDSLVSGLDTVAYPEHYQLISDDQEKTATLSDMVLKPGNTDTPKGTALTQMVQGADGSLIRKTSYDPFVVGTKLSGIAAQLIDGKPFVLQAEQHKVWVLNCWFTGCLPCIEEMPMLNQVAAAYRGKDVRFLSVTFDAAAQVNSFLKTHAFDWEKLVGAKAVTDQLGVSSYPATVLLDQQGTIRFVKIGTFKDQAELTREIDRLKAQ